MKIILLQDIGNIGRKNEIKEVKDGYARNILLPQKLVQVATAENVRKLQSEIKKHQTEKENRFAVLHSQAATLSDIVLLFPVRANEKGEIFGSVSAKEIEKSLAEKGFKNTTAILEKPLKKIGEYQIEIDLGKGIKTKVSIKIFKSTAYNL